MKKMILLSSLLLMATAVSMAQGIRIGAKAGANFSSATGDDVPNIDGRTGFHIGGVVQFELTDIIAIQPEAVYSMRGFKDGDFTIKVDYIDVPVLADIEVVEGLSLQGGPLFGINLSGTVENGNGDEADIQDLSTLNVGAVIGAQYELPLGLFFGVRYDVGFNDLIDNNFDAKNSNLSASAGFFFN